MRRLTLLLVLFAVSASVSASGRIGFYGIVEKVVFEPNETAPERIQVWGAFMYVDGGASKNIATSAAKRGYLYFKIQSLHSGYTPQAQVDLNKKEWADLKAVAGTGQAVGFGSYGYIGRSACWSRTASPRRRRSSSRTNPPAASRRTCACVPRPRRRRTPRLIRPKPAS